MSRLIRIIFPLWMLIGISVCLSAQTYPDITLKDIYISEAFTPRRIEGLRSMNDGNHYTVQQGHQIVKFSYQTGKEIETLFDADRFREIKEITGYSISDTENRILIETAREKIYRHSYRAGYYVFDMHAGTLDPLTRLGKVQLGTFSPSGTKVAFVYDNNLYFKDLESEKEIQVTFDGVRNQIINGIPDWVYEEEFAFSRGFQWSPDGQRIAFYRFDEREVKEFHMTLFGSLYPESYRFKYPKAGEDNAIVSIHVYDLQSGETTAMDTGTETDQYIPRIKWTRSSDILSIIRLNRLQNQMDILHADAVSGSSRVVYSEINNYYISEPTDKTITYLPDGESFILISERDGYFHLYHYQFETGQIRSITAGECDIDTFLGYDEKKKRLYYTSYEESSVEKHVYTIQLNGKGKKRMSTQSGTSSASFSADYSYYILEHSSSNSPPVFTLHNRKGDLIRVLEDNRKMKERMEQHGFANTEFLTIPTQSGQELNAWMIKPNDFNSGKAYPLFIYVYGGPESQKVIDSWERRTAWFQLLVQQGYIVACVDNRGTNGRGETFRKATYLTLGHLETIDQLEAAHWLGSRDYIDANRMGIFGWSYGGFMTSLCMTKGQGTFKMGIAVAPVTNWRYYDTIYTERFMRTPRENPRGYDQNSPIHYAKGLQGAFLLIHGSGDDNVHYQNSMDFVEALVQADKQFEMQFYPNKSHGISGGNTSYHLYTRMTDFILENL